MNLVACLQCNTLVPEDQAAGHACCQPKSADVLEVMGRDADAAYAHRRKRGIDFAQEHSMQSGEASRAVAELIAAADAAFTDGNVERVRAALAACRPSQPKSAE